MPRLIAVLLVAFASAAFCRLGVDMSIQECSAMNQSDWDCLVNNGFTFAIIQAFQGGNGVGPDTARCIREAFAAGMNHVDIYIFMCPNGCNNDNASEPVVQAINAAAGTGFGMVWFDVEMCNDPVTCWYDAATNEQYILEGVRTVQKLGYGAGIYSSLFEWPRVMNSSTAFSDLMLWYADPNTAPAFNDPGAWSFGGWTYPTVKQYAWSGPCMGGSVDLDYIPGNGSGISVLAKKRIHAQ